MRHVFLSAVVSLLLCVPAGAGPLRLSGPPIAESIPLLAMAQGARAWDQDFEAEFIPWHSPDMLRAMVAGGQVDAAIVTTAAASTLKSKGVKCRVALLHEAPVWIVSARPGPQTLESLEGTLLFPFGPGEMPELFYKAAMASRKSSVVTRHAGGALEAVNLLLAGKGDHAMLSEPLASIAVLRSKAMHDKGAPLLVKRVDMRDAWQRAFPGHRLASSSIVFFGEAADDVERIRAFNRAYALAGAWMRGDPQGVLRLARDEYPALGAQLERVGMIDCEVLILEGRRAVGDALFFLERIREISSAAIGGALPEAEFFEVGR